MKSYQICNKTVMDTSDQSISFDKNGVSNHYWDYQKNIKNIFHDKNLLTEDFNKKIESIKFNGRNKEFDSILGLSGGMDSSYMLHKMVREYGLKPLVFHVDGGWNTQIAVNNIKNMVKKLNLELFTEVIDWNEMRNFQIAMFKSGLPYLDIPQDMAFAAVLYKFAEKYKIKTILNGGNIVTESVMRPFELIYYGGDMTLIKDVLEQYCPCNLNNFPFISVLYKRIFLKYFKNIRLFKPLNYLNYNRTKAIRELRDNYNWMPYSQKHFESRFTRFYEGYWLISRYGFDMRRVEFSSLILSNQMNRESAIKILETPPLDSNQIKEDREYICTKLDITEKELNSFHDLPKKYFFNYKNNYSVLKMGEKVMGYLKMGRRGGAF